MGLAGAFQKKRKTALILPSKWGLGGIKQSNRIKSTQINTFEGYDPVIMDAAGICSDYQEAVHGREILYRSTKQFVSKTGLR